MRPAILLAAPVLLLACEPVTVELPMMGGYRDPADQCRRVGESEYTNQFLDHTQALVACPADYEGIGVFVTETAAAEVDRVGPYVLYSVPLE